MCFDLHTEVRHTAGHKGVGVDVFMTGQEGEEEKRAALLYGILHTVTIRTFRFISNQKVASFTVRRLNVCVHTSMSDSDWQGPLKSRSTEGQALS